MATAKQIWYPKDYDEELQRKRGLASNFPNVPVQPFRYYPSNEAIREVVEAQKLMKQRRSQAVKVDDSTSEDKAAPNLAPVAPVRGAVRSGSPPTTSPSQLAKPNDSKLQPPQRARSNTISSGSESDARKSRQVILERGDVSISIVGVATTNSSGFSNRSSTSSHRSQRSLDVVTGTEDSESTKRHSGELKTSPTSSTLSVSPKREAPAVPQPPRSSPPSTVYSFPSIATSGGSSSASNSRFLEVPALNSRFAHRSYSDDEGKSREPVGAYPPYPVSPPGRRDATHVTMPSPRVDFPKEAAAVPNSASRYTAGDTLRPTPVRSALDSEAERRRSAAPVKPTASAWRTVDSSEVARRMRKLRIQTISEEDPFVFDSEHLHQAEAAPRRGSFDAAASGNVVYSDSVRRRSFDSATSSQYSQPRWQSAFAEDEADPPRSVLQPVAGDVPVARPRPPAHVRSLLRRSRKTLSKASMDVWTGTGSDGENSAPESTRSSMYSVVPPPRDPRIGVELWRENDARQLRKHGRRVKAGVAFDLPGENLPPKAVLTETTVAMLPDAVRYHNER